MNCQLIGNLGVRMNLDKGSKDFVGDWTISENLAHNHLADSFSIIKRHKKCGHLDEQNWK